MKILQVDETSARLLLSFFKSGGWSVQVL